MLSVSEVPPVLDTLKVSLLVEPLTAIRAPAAASFAADNFITIEV